DQPLGNFRGVVDMHFGDISFYHGGGQMVLFSGMASNGVLIGLVGSMAHVIGAPVWSRKPSATRGRTSGYGLSSPLLPRSRVRSARRCTVANGQSRTGERR